jgi:hypothetical protein
MFLKNIHCTVYSALVIRDYDSTRILLQNGISRGAIIIHSDYALVLLLAETVAGSKAISSTIISLSTW